MDELSIDSAVHIVFSETLSTDKYRVFELPNEVVESLIDPERKNEIQIKGTGSQDAVLCSTDRTYSIRQVENSDTLLITSPMQTYSKKRKILDDMPEDDPKKKQYQRTVNGRVTCFYCVEEITPTFESLLRILPQYRGKDLTPIYPDESKDNKNITFEYLLQIIQVSKKQLEDGLKLVEGCNINNKYYILEDQYKHILCSSIFDVVLAKQLDIYNIDISIICNHLTEHEPQVVKHILYILGDNKDDDNNDNGMIKMDQDKVCRMYVKSLFLKEKSYFESELLSLWQELVPFGMVPTIDMLTGIAINKESLSVSTGIHENTWIYFPVLSLSSDPAIRFSELFDMKPKWSLSDIKPYVESILQPGQTMDRCLLKYSRALRTKVNGITEIVYAAR